VSGTLISKTEDKTYNLIKEMAVNNYQGSNECEQPKRVGGKFDIDALILPTAKMDAMTQWLDRLNVNAGSSYVPSPTCGRSGFYDLVTVNYQVVNLPLPPMSMLHM